MFSASQPPFDQLKPRPPARPGTAPRACGTSSGPQLERPSGRGGRRPLEQPERAAAVLERSVRPAAMEQPAGSAAVGPEGASLPHAASASFPRALPLLISSRRRSTSRRHTTLDASRHASCRTSFLHGITSNGRRIRRTNSTTRRETSLEVRPRLYYSQTTRIKITLIHEKCTQVLVWFFLFVFCISTNFPFSILNCINMRVLMFESKEIKMAIM